MRNSLRTRTVLAAALLLPLVWATAAQAQGACGSASTTLFAGQTINSGTVTVSNDETNLYVTYNTAAPWQLTQIHVAVADSADGLPQNKSGNPVPGQFPYNQTLNPAVSTYTVTIPLAGLGDPIFVAAHAVVKSSGPGGTGARQTGWGYGPQFPGNNWGTYFIYSLAPCGGGGE
jgi:hypothetical protein